MSHEGKPHEQEIDPATSDFDENGPMPLVTVLRSSGEIEHDWLRGATFVDDKGKARTVVKRPSATGDGFDKKHVLTTDLESWQPQQGLIDQVPLTQAQLYEINEANNRFEQAKRNAVAEEASSRIDHQLDALTEGFSEEDKLQLWNFSREMLYVKEARERGDGDGSYAHQGNAGAIQSKMSPAAKAVSSNHSRLVAARSKL